MPQEKATIRLYDTNPYDTEFDACILSARPGRAGRTAEVVLDRTLFFPEEGGQTPDRGTLAGFPVIDVQISADQIITHTLDVAGRESAAAAPDTGGCNAPADAAADIGGRIALPDAAADTFERNTPSDTSAVPCGRNTPSDTSAVPCGHNAPSAASADADASDDSSSGASIPLLSPGKRVHGILDWGHRFSNMQNHSGEHILSGLLHSIYGYENVGFRLSDHTVTLDTSGHLTREELLDLEKRANEVVWRNVRVTCEYPEPARLAAMDYRSKKEIDGAVRIVTIEGVDVCACCAPHVCRTGEIGLIKILSAINSRGGSTRITLVCGSRALEVMQQRQEQTEECSRLMNEPQESIAGGVARLQDEIAGLKEEVRIKEQRITAIRLEEASRAAAAAQSCGGIGAQDQWIFESALSTLSQRDLMNRLCDMGWRYAGVFVQDGDPSVPSWKYLIGSRTTDARVPNQLLRERLKARGGGKPAMVQGSVTASEEDVRAALRQ